MTTLTATTDIDYAAEAQAIRYASDVIGQGNPRDRVWNSMSIALRNKIIVAVIANYETTNSLDSADIAVSRVVGGNREIVSTAYIAVHRLAAAGVLTRTSSFRGRPMFTVSEF